MLSWCLRKRDGTEFGPAPLEQFCLWARQNRISSKDELCPEGGAWKPASEISALALDWFIQADESTKESGPYHMEALTELVLNEDLPPLTPIRRSNSQVSRPAALVILAEARAAQNVTQEIDANPPATWKRLYERELDRNNRLMREQKEALTASRARETNALAVSRVRETEARAELADARHQLHQLQKDYEQLQELLRSKPNGTDLLEWAGFLENHRTLLNQYEEMTARFEAQAAAKQVAQEAIHTELAQMQGLLEAQAQRAAADRELAAAAVEAQRTIETQWIRLQRAYRDLNEKYIRDKAVRFTEPPPANQTNSGTRLTSS